MNNYEYSIHSFKSIEGKIQGYVITAIGEANDLFGEVFHIFEKNGITYIIFCKKV